MKVLAIILVVLPAVFTAPAEDSEGRSLPVGVAATGTLGTNFAQQNAASENHDKKQFGVNFSSDKGSSSQVSNTGLQAAATQGLAKTQGYPQYQYPQYPQPYPLYHQYPYQYPVYQYPQYPQYSQYPVYPNYGVGVPNVGVPNYVVPNVGVPNLGSESSVQLPNVGASSGATVGQVPVVRY